MGLFDLFRKKKDQYHMTNKRVSAIHGHVQDAFDSVHNNVSTLHGGVNSLHSSFAALHADIAQQKEWLRYLHEHHISLHDRHSSHTDTTKSELSKVNSWISFLHKGQQKQEKHLKELQQSLEETMGKYHQHLSDLGRALEKTHTVALEAHQKEPQIVREEMDHDAIKEAVVRDIDIDIQSVRGEVKQELHEALSTLLDERHSEHKDALREVLAEVRGALEEIEAKQQEVRQKPAKHVVPEAHSEVAAPEVREIMIPTISPLTNPEQKLLNLLISEGDPLSYAKIGQLTGHSINTVRVNMNVLKKKGLIEESTLPSGVKLFSVTSREKVRTMYNLQVI